MYYYRPNYAPFFLVIFFPDSSTTLDPVPFFLGHKKGETNVLNFSFGGNEGWTEPESFFKALGSPKKLGYIKIY